MFIALSDHYSLDSLHTSQRPMFTRYIFAFARGQGNTRDNVT